MSTEPIFFNPVFKERIWGGAALHDFHYNIPSERTGSAGPLPLIKMGRAQFETGCIKDVRSVNCGSITEIYSETLKETVFLFLQKFWMRTKICPFRCIRMMTLPKCMKTGTWKNRMLVYH